MLLSTDSTYVEKIGEPGDEAVCYHCEILLRAITVKVK